MLSPKEFGAATGLHKSAISRLRSGKRAPSLAKALEIYAATREAYGPIAGLQHRQIEALQRNLGGKL